MHGTDTLSTLGSISLQDYFAGQTLKALLVRPEQDPNATAYIVNTTCAAADEMLKARKEKT